MNTLSSTWRRSCQDSGFLSGVQLCVTLLQVCLDVDAHTLIYEYWHVFFMSSSMVVYCLCQVCLAPIKLSLNSTFSSTQYYSNVN